MHKDILDFISHFSNSEELFTCGQCYYFMKILQIRFRDQYICVQYYNPILNHFALCIDNSLYDATGLIEPDPTSSWLPWHDYIRIEPLGADRVYRDCVLQVSLDQIEQVPERVRHIK